MAKEQKQPVELIASETVQAAVLKLQKMTVKAVLLIIVNVTLQREAKILDH